VIMTRLGDRRPVENEKTGFLVESNPESVLRLLGEVREDREKLKELGRRAREIVERTYDASASMARQRTVYETVLQSGGT